MNDEKCVVPVPTMSAKIAPLTATGGEGTTDYNKLRNKPSINDVPLEGNKTLDDLGIQPKGNYALSNDIPTDVSELNNDVGYITGYTETDPTVPDYVKNISEDDIARWNAGGSGGEGTSDYNVLTNKPKINGKVLLGDVSLEEIGAQPTGDYALKSDIPVLDDYPKKEEVDKRFEGIDHDVENLTELYKELADNPEEIYVGYISSITPGRDAIEKILGDAIKSGASTLILRPTTDLPQDFTAIGSGPNLQKYKNGGKGLIKFTDVNEHTTINAMPSVISYVTTVSFSVTADDEIDVTITDVQTKFISGINSTSQQAYVIHTKNEEAYTPTKEYHPSTKKYVDDAIVSKTLTKDNTTEYTPTTDYNPATKKYADSIKDDIPTSLSQLTNDLLNESDKENFVRLSQENPGKFYFWGE